MPELRLLVNGERYYGWKSAQVTRGIESIAGGFSMSVSDRWGGQLQPWPIGEGDECRVFLGDTKVITGIVDRRALSYAAEDRSLSVSGRDLTAQLVDCSVLLDRWEFRKIELLKFVRQICDPFGIDVEMQAGITAPKPSEKFSVDPGDTAFDAIEKACRLAAMLPTSDGDGGLLLTRVGASRCVTSLVEGENIISASADYDTTSRYHRYVVLGQRPGTDTDNGPAVASVKGEARDLDVNNEARVLVVRAENAITTEQAKRRAEWAAKIHAARGDVVTVRVQGWTQADGSIWPVNAIAPVRSGWIGVDGDMLITQAVYTLDETSGTTTELTLKRPDALLPEPVIPKGGGSMQWKEIAGGV